LREKKKGAGQKKKESKTKKSEVKKELEQHTEDWPAS